MPAKSAARTHRRRRSAYHKNGFDGYRIFQSISSGATLLVVLFGGISVWTTIVSNQSVTQAIQQRQGDDIKDIKTQLQILTDKVQNVQIGLGAKADRK